MSIVDCSFWNMIVGKVFLDSSEFSWLWNHNTRLFWMINVFSSDSMSTLSKRLFLSPPPPIPKSGISFRATLKTEISKNTWPSLLSLFTPFSLLPSLLSFSFQLHTHTRGRGTWSPWISFVFRNLGLPLLLPKFSIYLIKGGGETSQKR